jgi:hypothetical protein
MKFKLPRKLKKFLKKCKWVDKETGKTAYPWNSQLDYKKYKEGIIVSVFTYIDPTL